MKKIRPIKNTWFDWLINYIPERIRKSVSALKDKIRSIYKSITLEQTVYGRGQKLSKPKNELLKSLLYWEKKTEKFKDQIIKGILNLFGMKDKKEERKRLEKLERKIQEHNERLISNRMIRGIRTLFEQEDDNLKPKGRNNFWKNNYIEYQSSGDKSLSLNEYLNKIKTHLKNIIKDLQHLKIQLTAAFNFTSLKDANEEREMYVMSGNVKFKFYNDVNIVN